MLVRAGLTNGVYLLPGLAERLLDLAAVCGRDGVVPVRHGLAVERSRLAERLAVEARQK